MNAESIEVETSSGNTWGGIPRADADEALARAELMRRVTDIIRRRRLTQARAAELLDTNQPTVSDLMRGKLSKFSLGRLLTFLNALGKDVEIRVRPADGNRAGRVMVTPAE